MNDFPHISQLNGLIPLCLISCCLRAPDCVNDFPHVSHVKGLTPVCVLSCVMSVPDLANDVPHVSQLFNTCMNHFVSLAIARLSE